MLNQQNLISHNLQKKTGLLGLLILGCFGLLLVRMFDLQVLKGEQFRALADENRFYVQTIPATRGIFLDRYLRPVVLNQKYYYQLENSQALFSPRKPISRDQALKLMAEDEALVSFELRRQYQFPWVLAHVLGYTGPVSAQDLINNEQLAVNDWVGKMGLEASLDQYLAGVKGKKRYEINTMGQKQRLLEEQPAQPGHDVKTTLDPVLTKIAYRALEQKQGAVVILDAATGEILSLVSKPSFNANDLTTVALDEQQELKRQQNLQNYFQDERQVFFDRAVSGSYPPGSIFKLITALAALDQKAVDAQKTVLDEGILKVGDYEYANWYYTQYGRVEGEISLLRAIARSNDIYFYKAAEWTGPNEIAQMAKLFGLGKKTGIRLAHEAQGLIPDPAWKEKTLGERWFLGNTYHFGIGQGDVLVSPVQVAQMLQAIANHGELCQPRLVKSQQEPDQNHCQGLSVKEEHLNLVLQGMIGACSPGGTAYPFFELNEEVFGQEVSLWSVPGKDAYSWLDQGAVAGKTGTAEFGPADDQGYRKTHAWFGAIVGVDEQLLLERAEELNLAQLPWSQLNLEQDEDWQKYWLKGILETGFPKRLVVVTLVESDQAEPFREGSADAAPVAKQIVDWLQLELPQAN